MKVSLQLAIVIIVILPVALVVILEMAARFFRFRFAPFRLKFLYILFLLNDEAIGAIYEITQRTERAGLRSFDQLFELYASASGKGKAEVERLFGFPMPWHQLLNSRFSLDNHLQWHIGLLPRPSQQLRTLSIMSNGKRAVGMELDESTNAEELKRVVLTGGSVAFGYGATSDAATIAGRLQYHLNRSHSTGSCWRVENSAFQGGSSFQELICVMQKTNERNKPDYLVSVSGWNDADQQFHASIPNSSAHSQGYTDYLQYKRSTKQKIMQVLKPVLLVIVVARFVSGYINWSGKDKPYHGLSEADRVSTQGEIDNPNIYPLY